MSGFPCQRELGVHEQLRLQGPCSIAGLLVDLGEWPGLVPGDGVVRGELFEVLDERVWSTLDPFEDYLPGDPGASSFLRSAVRLLHPDLDAWVYIAHGAAANGPVIASGSWMGRPAPAPAGEHRPPEGAHDAGRDREEELAPPPGA